MDMVGTVYNRLGNLILVHRAHAKRAKGAKIDLRIKTITAFKSFFEIHLFLAKLASWRDIDLTLRRKERKDFLLL
jgi:hypothetical protein